jgi:hypothetical protein
MAEFPVICNPRSLFNFKWGRRWVGTVQVVEALPHPICWRGRSLAFGLSFPFLKQIQPLLWANVVCPQECFTTYRRNCSKSKCCGVLV